MIVGINGIKIGFISITITKVFLHIPTIRKPRDRIYYVPAKVYKNARRINWSKSLHGNLFKPRRRRQIVLVLLYILSLQGFQLTTVGPLLSAELYYPRFRRPKFGTPNLCEIQ